MPLFRYKARSARGDLLEGTLEAGSAQAVATQLLNSGITPVSIAKPASRSSPFARLSRLAGLATKPALDDLILFSRQMYALMKSGIPIVRGMQGLTQSSRNPVMVRVLNDVTENLESGRELSNALGRHPEVFPSIILSTVRVGENTGRLDEAFLQISQYLEAEKDTRQRVKSALRYPTLVIIATAVAVGIVNTLVIPAFAEVFERSNVPLPLPTRVLIAVSDFFAVQWPVLLAVLVAALFAFKGWMRTERGRYRWDKWKLRFPIVGGIVHRAMLARFARAFALASRAGVPIVQTLTVVSRALDNEYIGDRVLEMRNGIERGDTLTRTAAATGLFTPLVLQMLAVAEETGAVEEMLEDVAGFYEREVHYDLKNLSAAIEPVLIVAVGALVLVLALGVFLPMWDLSSGVGLR
ncbi:MAG: type II secretion system F family protein [Gammaproteobacteria bacterium]|nr:type II secretion system F family protein [Gammaproteobacteria bacterium]NIR81810.1 type II secretion system F family protein [Gammaproteobacteria bacterium]NIR88642.1 type II secretion system F family protein [Gammaproteobacteria bacterium]NIU02918.1 type II secretion system F family protein [Gammaproteobacteria bacterium]NIV50439.1 type II secretion system F family protein [Gammaproteobacteria bacterium]